jgi:polyisoprenyl-phosphate glycosyltransferase
LTYHAPVMSRPRYSVVIPIFNETETLPELWSRLSAVLDELDGDAEVVFVDDGSFDGTAEALRELALADTRIQVLRLSRNFGHQIAISAGLDYADGDAVVIMDGDLQDPPEVIPQLVEKWQAGYDLVYAVRRERSVEPFVRRAIIKLAYRVLRWLSDTDLPLYAGDFRLADRRVVAAVRSLRERNRYVRGMFSWVGFRQIGVEYRREERFAGMTKYPYRKLVKLAADGLISFSNVPLRMSLAIGFLVSVAAFVFGAVAIALKLANVFAPPGWASIVVVVAFLGGVQLVVIGMMGLYIGRVYDEVKARPLYVVEQRFAAGEEVPAVPAQQPTTTQLRA